MKETCIVHTKQNPSGLYLQCLGEARRHHLSSKTYSGKFLRPHAPFIKEIIDRLGCRSILDYGCGKGSQYQWVSHGEDASIPKGETLESFWGVPVTKFDPAWPPFAVEPAPGQTFDLVICTHALGSIPKSDLLWAIRELYDRANKAVYIAEKLGPVRKQVFSDPDRMPRGWSHFTWGTLLAAARQPQHAALEIRLATRSKFMGDGEVHTQSSNL